MEDLDDRGLLDETLVVVMSEMGRTPRVNGNGGRDHWTFCYSVMFAGAGIRGGTVYGASDAQAAYVKDRPVSTADICATIYQCLGIDPDMTVPDRSGPAGTRGPGRAADPRNPGVTGRTGGARRAIHPAFGRRGPPVLFASRRIAFYVGLGGWNMSDLQSTGNRRASRRRPPRAQHQKLLLSRTHGIGRQPGLFHPGRVRDGRQPGGQAQFKAGEEMEVNLEGIVHRRPIRKMATVVWCVPTENNCWVAGVKFQGVLRYADLNDLARL